MGMSDPAALKAFLDERGLKAKKSFSQNFLVDRKALEKIVLATGLRAGERVLEIGPGPGALTEAFLAHEIAVTAIELDQGFARALQDRGDPRLEIIEGDALVVDLRGILEREKIDVVAGNLPYAITTPLLGRLLTQYPIIKRVVVMVQKEVADRMCAEPGGKTFGLLSLFTQLHARPKIVCRVPARSFRPAPKVDSAVVSLDLIEPAAEAEGVMQLARVAFQQRRKMVRGTLSSLLSPAAMQRGFEISGVKPEARPEQIGVQQWCQLARATVVGGEYPQPDA
jgi:16S rRNA (adenine1518-N6/adenine1519-N6)-dimethyltransferase